MTTGNDEIDPGLWRQLVAEQAIQRVINDYGRGIDERDFERVRSCFHPDARIIYGKEPDRSLDEAVAWLEQMLPALFALSHYFGPAIVDLSEDGQSAVCQTWCINVIQYPRGRNGEETQTASGLLYDDVFECRGGRWRIAERRNHTEWNLAVDGNLRLPVAGGPA
jgi:hypothetical protein